MAGRKRAQGASASRRDSAGPLAWLARRRDASGRPLLSEAQRLAGERLARDFWFARMTPRVTADWSGTVTSGRRRRAAPSHGADLRDAQLAARERVRRALDAVGAELSGVLVDVCCLEEGLEAAERAQGWPKRSGKVILQLALTRLARHYGLDEPTRGSRAAARILHWGTEDYRPRITDDADEAG